MAADGKAPDLLHDEVKVVNVGLEAFYRSLRVQNVAAVHVDWRPPAGGDEGLINLLDRLSGRRADR